MACPGEGRGDVGDPDLIKARGDEIADEIGGDEEAVVAVSGLRREGLLAQAQKVVFAHEAQNPLFVHVKALPFELRRHRAVAVVLVFKGDGVDGVADVRVGFGRGFRVLPAIKAGAGHARQLAEILHIGCALQAALASGRHGWRRHGFKRREEAVADADASGAAFKTCKAR